MSTRREIARHELAHAVLGAVVLAHVAPGAYVRATCHLHAAGDSGECALVAEGVAWADLERVAHVAALGPERLAGQALSERDCVLASRISDPPEAVRRWCGAAERLWRDLPVARLVDLVLDPRVAAFEGEVALRLLVPRRRALAALAAADRHYAATIADPRRAPAYV